MVYRYNEYGLWDNIISLMLMNENRIVRKDLEKIYGKSVKHSIDKLTSKGYVKTKLYCQPHFLYLTNKGLEYVSKNTRLPKEILKLNSSRKLTYTDADVIRLIRKSQVLSDMALNNIPVSDKLISKLEPLFIPTVFLRQELEQGIDQKAGVTCKGVITKGEAYYGLYTMQNGNQLLSPNIEAETTLRIEECLKNNNKAQTYTKAKIVFDYDKDGFEKLIKNQKNYERSLIRDRMINPTKHILEAKNWSSAFYVPIGEASKEHIKAILNPSEARAKILKKNNLDNNAIVFYPYNLFTLKHIITAKNNEKVYVLEEDKELLEEIAKNDKVNLIPVLAPQ